MNRVVIWGTGKRSMEMMINDVFATCDIICFVDNFAKSDEFMCHPVIRPEKLSAKDYDWLIIPLSNPGEVFKQCKQLGIDDNKIIIVENTILNDYKYHEQNINKIKNIIPALYDIVLEHNAIRSKWAPIRRCLLDMEETYDPRIVNYFNGTEYTRFRTMELASREVNDRAGDWSVAELGVWQGGTSRLISLLFPERNIYMFDTFESFDKNEVQREIENGNCDEKLVEILKNTSVERVLNIMPDKNKCIVRKGLFPGTAEGLEDIQYGFVSLDVDLEVSTYAGLEYFVPRMIEGGYIFLNNFNHVSLKGVKNAVKKMRQIIKFGLERCLFVIVTELSL